MKKIATEDFRVRPGKKVDLAKWSTSVEPLYKSKEDCAQRMDAQILKLRELQNLLYASNQYSLLLIFQAMDAAGKDSAIKNVMSGINPQGCQVYSFKHPSEEELDHDFLWNAERKLPERGRIGIFNRSYYEEVLIVRVHPEILHSQNLPAEDLGGKSFWKDRYQSITSLEDHLCRNGTKVLKFFLHLSKDEQRKRFLARIDNPEKNWKFGSADMEERKFWDQYMDAYERCLSATSSKSAPWYVIPADDKKNTQLLISEVVLETLQGMKMEYPETTPERAAELQTIRTLLTK
jgi:PPK2 family polyphosphate:nucleotide phosphotransferase